MQVFEPTSIENLHTSSRKKVQQVPEVVVLPRAPTKTLFALLFVNSAFTLAAYAALSAGSPGWASNLKTFAFCSAIGILAVLSANQIMKKEKEENASMFGRKEKENGVNWEERVKATEAPAEAAAETEEKLTAKPVQKDLSPKKIIEMVKALAESAQLTDEETWAAIKEKSDRAAESFARLESALQSALDASREARAALEELSARVGEHAGV